VEGPAFLNILSPCPRGWRYKPEDTLQICRLAADTCVWPLYEIEDGKLSISHKPRDKKPVEQWLKSQGRFKHLFTPQYEHLVQEIQEDVDKKWNSLLRRQEFDKEQDE
jgi:pyruvate ferredoxin oxidoreductase beta subunit